MIRTIISTDSSIISGEGPNLLKVGLEVDPDLGAVSRELGPFRPREARFVLFGTNSEDREGTNANQNLTVISKIHQKQHKNQPKDANQHSTSECSSNKIDSTNQNKTKQQTKK